MSTITIFGLLVLAIGGRYSARNLQVLLIGNIVVLGLAYACHRLARRDSMPGIVACTLLFQAVMTFSISYRAHLDDLGMSSVYYMCLLVLLLGTLVAPNRWILLASWVVVLGQVIAFGLSDPVALSHQNRHLMGYVITSVGISAGLFPLVRAVKWGSFRLLVESYERSTTDPLTGLANRMAWTQRVQEWIGTSHGKQSPRASVLYMDLDGLKKINDEHGHPAGDRVLVEIGDVLRRVLSAEAIIARFGGDEFVAFVPDKDSTEVAPVVAALHSAIKLNPKTLDHTIGIGVADYEGPEPIEAALHRADRALLSEKRDRHTRLAQAQKITETTTAAEVKTMVTQVSRASAPAADPA